MSPDQRKTYFGRLWPAACLAQGWRPGDDRRRRQVTREATGQDSTSGLTQPQITRLFDLLKHLAEPLSLDRAIPVANPEHAEEESQRRQHVWAIRQLGFADAYVATVAAAAMAAESVATWPALAPASLESLKYTLRTRARARDTREQRDADTSHDGVDRQRRPFARKEGVTPYHRRKEVKAKRRQEREQPVAPRPGVQALIQFPF